MRRYHQKSYREFRIIPYYSILFCIILYYSVLVQIISSYSVLFRIIPYHFWWFSILDWFSHLKRHYNWGYRNLWCRPFNDLFLKTKARSWVFWPWTMMMACRMQECKLLRWSLGYGAWKKKATPPCAGRALMVASGQECLKAFFGQGKGAPAWSSTSNNLRLIHLSQAAATLNSIHSAFIEPSSLIPSLHQAQKYNSDSSLHNPKIRNLLGIP